MRYIYCKYFLVGSLIGCAAIAARELVGMLLHSDTPVFYLASVVVVYAGGIIASFCGHYRVTFSHVRHRRATLESIGKFVGIALIGMIITALLSYQIRYHLGLQPFVGKALPALAFGAAALLASFITYKLNSKFIFIDRLPED
jgi:putative flippase GtrA